MNDSEKGIIGCVLVDNNCLHDIYGKLNPEMFQSEFLRDCYMEMLALYDRGEKISTLELCQRLENIKYDREEINGIIKECVVSCPSSAYVNSYAKTIIADYKSISVKRVIEQICLLPKTIDSSIAEMISRLEELQTNEEVRSKSLKVIVNENQNNYYKDVVKKGVKTGFYKLDDCLGMLEGGDITVIGARPAVGKSALVTQIICQMAENGYRVGYFNLEMNESQVYERMVSNVAALSLTRLRRARSFLGGEEEMFSMANNKLSDYDVIISTGSKSIAEVRSESRHQRFDIIIIDYLQLIKAERHYGNRASEVGDISKAIKALAGELHIPIILLSQLNRTSEQRETKEPTMSELRESGDIEQDASNIVLIWNLSENSRSLKGLKVEKNRMGEVNKWGLSFDGDHMKFTERQEEFYQTLKLANSSSGFKEVDTTTPFD